MRNIFAGCVCCSSAGVLCQDVHTIRQEFAPDWLIIEATGMAFPDAIQESLLRELGISASVLALADASRWKRVLGAMRQFAVSQLKGASMVLVNKIDKVGQEALRETTESVEELAPGIPVHPVCAIQPIPETVWKSLPGMEEL